MTRQHLDREIYVFSVDPLTGRASHFDRGDGKLMPPGLTEEYPGKSERMLW
jgi:hypothetical protein